jgi:hypothetical protein
VPLSEHEQALLEQLERALTADDPGLASRLRGGRIRGRQTLVVGALVLALGAAATITGVVIGQIPLVVAGAVVMVAGAVVEFAVLRAPVPAVSRRPVGVQRPTPARVGGSGRGARALPLAPRAASSRRLMSRIEQRWESRRQQRRYY